MKDNSVIDYDDNDRDDDILTDFKCINIKDG